MSSSTVLHPAGHHAAAPQRDHLLGLADLLGAHPTGALMARLLGVPAAALRRLVRSADPLPSPAADHLAALDRFAGIVRERLADPDDAVRAARIEAWRRWLQAPSLPGPDGPIRPLDRLADPQGASDAVRDLVADHRLQPGGDVRIRLVSLVRAPGRSGAGS